MIYHCPVAGCGKLFESLGSDHQGREPCTDCYKDGWRDDGAGNLHRDPHVALAQPQPA